MTRRGRARRELPALSIDGLDGLVTHYDRLAKASARTQASHKKHWARWQRWCDAHDVDALAASGDDVVQYVDQAFRPPPGESTYRHYLAAVRHQYEERGLPDPTQDPRVRRLVRERVTTAAKQPRETRRHTARPLTCDEALAALTAEPPTPTPRATLLRVRLLIAYAADLPLLDARLRGAASDGGDRLILESGVHVPGGANPLTCPLAAWRAICAVAPDSLSFQVGRGVDVDRSGQWSVLAVDRADALHVSAIRSALRRTLGPDAELDLRRSLRDQISAEDLSRLSVHLHPALALHLRDSAIISLQVWGGLRSSDIARLRWETINDVAAGMLLHLPWQKNDQQREGHTRFLPALPDRPELSPTAAILNWRWLIENRLGPNDPVIPKSAAQAVMHAFPRPYDPDQQGDNTSMALSKPLKNRLARAGFDTRNIASHSGRKTLTTLALLGGAPVADVAAHIGDGPDVTAAHYFEIVGDPLLNQDSAACRLAWDAET